MKIHKTKSIKKAQKAQIKENVNGVEAKVVYTVRAMFNDLSKWENFIKQMDGNEKI